MNTEHVPREVIKNKLLAALDDEGKVAIVASQRDLELLIYACEVAENHTPSKYAAEELAEMRTDLRELYRSAFMKGE